MLYRLLHFGHCQSFRMAVLGAVAVFSFAGLLISADWAKVLAEDVPQPDPNDRDGIHFAYEPHVMFSADSQFLFAREPILRRMPDGTLVALIYTGGDREPHPDNVVAIVRSTDDGATWSAPEVLFRHPHRACWATELFTEGDVPFAVFQTFDAATHYCELRAYMAFTTDSGKTWSNPVTIPGVPPNFTVRQGRVLADGSWLFPIYWQEVRDSWQASFREPHSGWQFVSGVIRSTDQGKSFTLHGNIRSKTGANLWEPDVTELEPGHLLMYLRSETPENVLWKSESFDSGKTWSDVVPTDIHSPASKAMMQTVCGRKVLFFNHTSPDAPRRNSLEAWVSSDGCKTWGKKLQLARLMTDESTWEHFFKEAAPLPQVAYPHAFVDEKNETVYVAIDAVRKFYLLKIPFADLLEGTEEPSEHSTLPTK